MVSMGALATLYLSLSLTTFPGGRGDSIEPDCQAMIESREILVDVDAYGTCLAKAIQACVDGLGENYLEYAPKKRDFWFLSWRVGGKLERGREYNRLELTIVRAGPLWREAELVPLWARLVDDWHDYSPGQLVVSMLARQLSPPCQDMTVRSIESVERIATAVEERGNHEAAKPLRTMIATARKECGLVSGDQVN